MLCKSNAEREEKKINKFKRPPAETSCRDTRTNFEASRRTPADQGRLGRGSGEDGGGWLGLDKVVG